MTVLDSTATREDVIERLERMIDADASIVIFPEGGRNGGRRLLGFAELPFVTAIQLGVPVVPVAVLGTSDVMPAAGFFRIRPGQVEIAIEEPIPTAGLIPEDSRPLREDVRGAIARYVEVPDVLDDNGATEMGAQLDGEGMMKLSGSVPVV